MTAFNDELTDKARAGTLGSDEKALFKQWRKALGHLSQNPRHPGLRTHEIDPLSARFGQKVFQSYLNQGDTADRFYWVYGPERGVVSSHYCNSTHLCQTRRREEAAERLGAGLAQRDIMCLMLRTLNSPAPLLGNRRPRPLHFVAPPSTSAGGDSLPLLPEPPSS